MNVYPGKIIPDAPESPRFLRKHTDHSVKTPGSGIRLRGRERLFLCRQGNKRQYFSKKILYSASGRRYAFITVSGSPERKGKEMLRLLGILSLGHLLFGGRHHRRALRRGLLLGALLGWLANKDSDMDRARKDARDAVRKARRTVHDAARAARKEIRNIRKEEHDQRTAERLDALRAEAEERRAGRDERKAEQKKAEAVKVLHALPECDTRESKEIRELAEDLERDARTAAMAADVPVIEFPAEEEGKYHASRKYGYS